MDYLLLSYDTGDKDVVNEPQVRCTTWIHSNISFPGLAPPPFVLPMASHPSLPWEQRKQMLMCTSGAADFKPEQRTAIFFYIVWRRRARAFTRHYLQGPVPQRRQRQGPQHSPKRAMISQPRPLLVNMTLYGTSFQCHATLSSSVIAFTTAANKQASSLMTLLPPYGS